MGTGGGISNWSGSVTISNSRISHHSAHFGAGIFNSGGPLTLSNSTVSDNDASEGYGGGIYNVDAGTLMLDNSTVSDNSAANGWGDGINNGYVETQGIPVMGTQGGRITLTNSTISGNTALYGGGILTNADWPALFIFSTIYGNIATREGGGLAIKAYDSRKPSHIEIRNTLVAGNRAPTSPNIAGTLTSDGYNLSRIFLEHFLSQTNSISLTCR
jgi:Right handed beta helix region